MKINSTVIIFFFVFLGSVAAGVTTGYFFYKFGSDAIESVKIPEENPAQKLSLKKKDGKTSAQGFKIKKEKKMLVEVYDFVYAQKKEKKVAKKK